FQAEDGIRFFHVTGVQTCALPIYWSYKTDSSPANSAQSRAREWVSNLVDEQNRTPSSLEFIESVKVDLFPDEVYLFTPRGKILRSEERRVGEDCSLRW